MTPKDKAKDIFNRYYELRTSANNILNIRRAKNYAIIAINLAIESNDFHLNYLEDVKEEIEKL